MAKLIGKVKECVKAVDKKIKDKKVDYWYMTSYADFGGDVGRVYDYQVADYAKKHLRFIDRFNFRKVGAAVVGSFEILSKSIEDPYPNKNWKFYRDY